MDVHDDWIPAEEFATFVEAMPQVCVELFLEHDGGVLLTRRTNEPAKGEWFWPGGRLFKGEHPEAAVARIAEEELGIGVELEERLGVYNHFWDTSDLPGSPSRHTVNLAYRVRPTSTPLAVDLDDQHDDWRLVRSADRELHEYVRIYLEDAGLFD